MLNSPTILPHFLIYSPTTNYSIDLTTIQQLSIILPIIYTKITIVLFATYSIISLYHYFTSIYTHFIISLFLLSVFGHPLII